MNSSNFRALLIAAALALQGTPAEAQVADGATNTLVNVTNSITGNLVVGTNGSFTLLTLSNNALLTNSLNGVIGANATAKSNTVQLTSATARWRMGNSLFVGSNGAASRIVVSNGGYLENNEGHLAFNAASSNNSALVTGGGSVWSNRSDLFIGGSGRNNQMLVSNGGAVFGGLGVLGRQSGGSSNLVLVSGSGSVWSNTLDLFVGNATAGNRLVIEAGGLVSCDEGYVGGLASANNNEVLVTGPGSLWHNRSFTTYIGLAGSNNRLVVSNGAAVWSPGGSVGGSSSSGNQVVVTGAGSTWTNLTLTVGSGLFGTANRVDVSDGGEIRTRNGTIGNAGFNNTVFVRDSGSLWNGAGNLIVGDSGSGNLLLASNGATVLSSNAFLGATSSAAQNNLVWLSGAGTLWSNQFDFQIGAQGGGNRLVVSNSAKLVSSNMYLGLDLFSGSNALEVTGVNSELYNLGAVFVGNGGAANQLTANGQAQVFNFTTVLGGAVSSSNNVVLVTGAGTFWATVNDLVVGVSGGGNQLVISNGATLYAANGMIGSNTSARSNSVTVTDPGTTLTIPTMVEIGGSGPFNRLIVTNGAKLDQAICALGTGPGGSNQVIVTGVNSCWTNTTLWIGTASRGNQLVIANGGQVHASEGIIGFGQRHNEAVVTGTGSLLKVTDSLDVGTAGDECRLFVTNQGAVLVATAVILGNSGSYSNRLSVDGGTLRVTNAPGTGVLDVRGGTNVLNAGTIELDSLQILNSAGAFEFNGGTLAVKNSYINTGNPFIVGNGSNSAILHLTGNGTNDFTGTLGLIITNNATLSGNGALLVQLQVRPGATLSPGDSIGRISVNTAPFLSGTTLMELSKNGGGLTNDQFQVAGLLTYGGALVVSILGPTTLAVGDNFPLFNATSYAGSFTAITLPTLASGLGWTNKLLVDGSLEVIGVPVPQFTGITVSGTNVVLTGTNGIAGADFAVLTATDVTLPVSSWVSLFTNQFGAGGQFSFTNGINPADLQRFFRLRTP